MKNKILFLQLFIICLVVPKQFAFGQAGFSASDTIGCTPMTVNFASTNASTPDYDFAWDFGDGKTSTEEDPENTFLISGTYEVIQTVTNRATLETDVDTLIITVIQPAKAELTVDASNSCVGGIIEFTTNFQSRDSSFWAFGDGSTQKVYNSSNYQTHIYDSPGDYTLTFITYVGGECSDTADYPITIRNQSAEFNINPEAVCRNVPVMFTLGSTTDVGSFFWSAGEGTEVLTGDSATYAYQTMGQVYPSLTINGSSGSCTLIDTIEIFEVVADFNFEASQLCNEETVVFFNASIGNDFNYWDLGDGTVSSVENPSNVYSIGDYSVSLKVESNDGCTDSVEYNFTVNEPPNIQILTPDNVWICPGETYTLEASGGDIINWSPVSDFDNPASYSPTVMPDSTTTYFAEITDTVTSCSASDEVLINVQRGFILGKISVLPADTAIYTGDTVYVVFNDTLDRTLSFNWLPNDQISCIDCAEPFVIPLQSTNYQLEVSDGNQCEISETFDINIEVTEAYRFGVPEAFTPNGDNRNDEIRVNGVGIMRLIEFRIYNRYGKEVFYTDDINQGWDGNIEGDPQPIDSYAYIIRAEMWNGSIQEEKGTFSLLR